MNSSRGSLWRKWDLHVHTPASIVQHYGGNSEEIWEKFICDLEALPTEFSVLGINDYLFLDGYERLIREKEENGRLQNIDMLLPVLEFRISKFAGVDFRSFKRINLHVIFSNEVDGETIKSQFLNVLEQGYKLAPGIRDGLWKGSITRNSLADFGLAIKNSTPADRRVNFDTDLIEGFNNLNLDEEQLFRALDKPFFHDKFLIAIGKTEWDSLNWTDGSIAEKKDIINKADIVFTSCETLNNFVRAKQKLKENGVNDLLLDCSDAHRFSDSHDKDRIGKCFTWIKADTTFDGLRQITYESERVYVGERPPILDKVRNNRTKYIQSLHINKVVSSRLNETWFNNLTLEFNPQLVTIIGNKGNGKSALLDILSLVGDTKNHGNFSFLSTTRFKKSRKASHFEAKLVWESGDESSIKNLMDVPEEHSYERVKYIPQNFFEKICNDNPEDLEAELKKVIFSHVDASEKLGQKSLEELINYKSQVSIRDITLFQNEVERLNNDIIDLEKKMTATYRKSIEESVSNKKLELADHQLNKPKEVAKLESNGDYQKSIDKEIKAKRAEKEKLEEELNLVTKKKSEQKIKQSNLERFGQAIDTFQSQYEKLKTEYEPVVSKIGLKLEDTVQVSIDKSAINTLVEALKIEIETLSLSIKPDNDNGLAFRINKLGEAITELQSKLDEPTKRYQTYLDDLAKWDQREQELIGAEDIELTLKYYEGVLRYLDDELENDLNFKRGQRKEVVSQLYEKKQAILEVYKELYKPVTDFLDQYKSINKDYGITFDVSFRLKDFEEKFLNYVNQAVKGTFYGNKEGTVTLKQMILETDFNTLEGAIEFFDKIIFSLECDRRSGQENESREIQSQIKNGFYLEMYNLIFNLDYLVPYYELKLGEKSIVQLSPGEKGALLLIFYLIIDQDDIPLIIDQPEENLDNQSVYNMLVPFIKHAKANRQIVIVTHNPNIAVVCDAEQIIHVSIDKTQDNEVSINSGAIENPSINSSIVQILEGTMPAFETRELKYSLTKNSEARRDAG